MYPSRFQRDAKLKYISKTISFCNIAIRNIPFKQDQHTLRSSIKTTGGVCVTVSTKWSFGSLIMAEATETLGVFAISWEMSLVIKLDGEN